MHGVLTIPTSLFIRDSLHRNIAFPSISGESSRIRPENHQTWRLISDLLKLLRFPDFLQPQGKSLIALICHALPQLSKYRFPDFGRECIPPNCAGRDLDSRGLQHLQCTDSY